ncbi:MAG: (d)CMP kinase [Thermoleophilia bacterium]|nr:(d)CMP kinase [Thermoleophilia bacterium]
MIIAIDGPAGSGKSTIAREVAKRLGLRYVDTGSMYRTVTLLAMEQGLVPDRVDEAGTLAAETQFRFVERPDDLTRVFVGEREVTDEIRGRSVSQNVSAVSADPAVRAVLTEKQREQAAKGDVVLEGRDMGTVVVPQADIKVFLTASVEERARRRQLQLEAQGAPQPFEQLVADITARDAYDSGREVAPLRKADDAVEIDTTRMTIDQVVEAVCALAEGKRARKWPLSRMVRSPLDTWLYRVAYTIIPPLCRLVFRMRVTGAENLPAGGPVLVACNHRSNLDPFFLGSAAPRMIHFMAKSELWSFKPLGRVCDRLGTFPVRRGEADRQAVKRALTYLEAGAVVGLFPEGRRQRELPLGEIRPGVSLFSLRAGVVTIPAVIRGTDRIIRNHVLCFPRVHVVFGSALEMPPDDGPRSERASVTTQRLIDALQRLLAAHPQA